MPCLRVSLLREGVFIFSFCSDVQFLEYAKKLHKHLAELPLEPPGVDPEIVRFCCFYLYQMARGLQYCHHFGFVHGDIKRKRTIDIFICESRMHKRNSV